MAELPLILIIEDNRDVWYPIQRMLNGRARVMVAEDVQTARKLARQYIHELSIVSFDAWMPLVPGGMIEYDNPGTIPLAAELKAAGFNRPMIAASACIIHNGSLLDAGCTHKCPKGTEVTLIEMIEQLLEKIHEQHVPCG